MTLSFERWVFASLSDFEVAIFWHLRVAPSQLHPNSIAFMREFEIICDHLKIGATIPFFFYCFHIHTGAYLLVTRWDN